MSDAPRNDPHLSAIESCLAAIRTRLFMVRATERLVLGLILGGVIAASFVLARYLKERFPLYADFALFSPLILLAIYWITQFNSRHRKTSILRITDITALTVVLTIAAVIVFWSGYWFYVSTWMIAATPLVIFAVFAFLAGRPVSPQAAAIFVDRRAGLQEKVSTAFELLKRGAITPGEARFQAPLVADAASACREVRASRVGYARMDRRLYLAAFLMAVGVFAFTLVTPLPALAARTKPKVNDPTVIAARRDLQQRLSELEKMKNPNDKGSDPLQGLKTMIERTPSDSDKLDALAAANKQIDNYSADLDKYKSNDKATSNLAKDKQLGELGKALSQFDNTMTKEGVGGSADAKAAARAEAEKAIAAAAKNLAAKLAEGNLSESDKNMIQNTLSAAADNAKGDPDLQAAIERAKEALAKNDAKALEKALNDIGTRMASNIGDKHANQDAYADARSALQKFSSQIRGDQNNQANGNKGENGNKTGAQQNGGQQNGGQQAGAQQNGGQQNGGQQAGAQQNGGQQNGGQQAGAHQNGGQQNGGQQAGAQQNGGQQNGGQQAGAQQNGGQQAGAQQAGAQQNGGQQNGGQQAGGQQAGAQQNGGQQGSKQQGGSQSGASQQNGGMEQANSSTAGGETLIDEQQANAGGEQGAQQGGEQGGEQGSQQGAEQGGSQQASSENDGGGAANGQQQAGAQKNGGQQGAGQQAGAGQQGAGQQSGQGQGGKQPGQGAGQMAAGQGSMGQGPGSHGNGHTNEFSPGGPSNDSGSQGVVGTMNPNAKGSQVVTTFGEKAQVKGQLDRTVKPDSVTPFMAPAETPGKTFMGYDPSAIESANQKVKDDLRTGRVSPKHQEIVKDFFNPDEQPQPK